MREWLPTLTHHIGVIVYPSSESIEPSVISAHLPQAARAIIHRPNQSSEAENNFRSISFGELLMNVFSSLSRTPKSETTTFRFAAALVTGVMAALPVMTNASTADQFSHTDLFADTQIESLSAHEMSETRGELAPLLAYALFGGYAGYEIYNLDAESRDNLSRIGLNALISTTSPLAAEAIAEAQRELAEAKKLADQQKQEQAKRRSQGNSSGENLTGNRNAGASHSGSGEINHFGNLNFNRRIGYTYSEPLPPGWSVRKKSGGAGSAGGSSGGGAGGIKVVKKMASRLGTK